MNDVGRKKDRIRGEHCTGLNKRANLTFLGIDRLIENLAAILNRTGARTIRTVVPDRPVRLAIDEEEMAQALAGVASCGGAVTILGDVVPIGSGVENEDSGCALLTVSVHTGHSAGSRPSGDALKTLRGIIKKHHGFLRLRRQCDEMRIALYLPVLHGV